MSKVSRVNQVERSVTHDDFQRPRPRAQDFEQLLASLDFSTIPVVCAVCSPDHWRSPERAANHAPVAFSIEAASHTGASRQYSMLEIISATPASNEIFGSQIGRASCR